MTRSFLPSTVLRPAMRALWITLPPGETASTIFAWVNRSCQVLTGKKLLPRLRGAWRARQAFACGLLPWSQLPCSVLSFSLRVSFNPEQNKVTTWGFSSRGVISSSILEGNEPFPGSLHARCDWLLRMTSGVRAARCLRRCFGSEWGSVETTPQRPKILKPPPNHPPQNKPSNRNRASAFSRSHRFPIAPSIPVHVSSLGSAASCPQIIRHSQSSPAACTRPE